MKVLEIFADFETRNSSVEDKGIIDLATLSYVDDNEGVISYTFTNIDNDKHIVEQLLDKIVEIKKSTLTYFNKNYLNHIIVYFHNGAKYDNFFIIDYMLENGFVQRLEHEYKKWENKDFQMMSSDSVKLLSIVVKYENCLIHFKDSYKKLTYPIAKIGELLDRKKLVEIGEKYYNKDFYALTEAEQLEYLKYAVEDTIIQCKGLQHFTNFLSECATTNGLESSKIQNINHWKNHTLSQAARNIHRELDWNEREKYIIKKEDYLFNHYKGGYTICNPIYLGKIVENVKAYDINSSYPSIMLNPVACEVITKDMYDKLFDNQKTKMYKVYIKSAKLKPGYVPIIRKLRSDQHDINRYIENDFNDNFDNNKFFTEINDFLFPFWFWKCEWSYIKKFYEIEYEIVDVIYFQKYKIFNRYINHFKNTKENADKKRKIETDKKELQKLEMIRNFSKLAMNCLSGKFGQKIKNENWLTTKKEIKPGVYKYDNRLIHIIKQKESLSKNSFLYKFAHLNDDFTRYINKQVPNNYIISYITAKGRCKLFEIIEKLKTDFVYCDTDSIYCINQTIPDNLIDDSEFGKWKFEGDWKYFKCLKPKCYILSNIWNLENVDWKNKDLIKTTLSGFKELTFLNEIKTLEDFKFGLQSEEWLVKKGKLGGKVWEKRIKIL